MKVKLMSEEEVEFNKKTYKVLKCGTPDGVGYYMDEEFKKIALDMMEKGILENNPVEEWSNSGWKATKKGIKLFKSFEEKLQKLHGHIWKTNRDCDPDDYKDEESEYADKVNIFAYSVGYHNGPECKKCGYSFCHHCRSEFDIPKCDKK